MTLLIVIAAITLLVILISKVHLHAFLAFLLVALLTALALGIPAAQVVQSVQTGIGKMLGALVIIIVLGAMLGKLVAESGAAQKIAQSLVNAFGTRYVTWAMMLTGFIVGIPLFYNVGFVLLVPLVFSVAYQIKLPAVYIGIPLLAALSVTHGFLPPHPSPTALVPMFKADMGLTLLYGIVIAVPSIIIAGPIFTKKLKYIKAEPLAGFRPQLRDEATLPSLGLSLITALLPVLLLVASTLFQLQQNWPPHALQWIQFAGEPAIVMLLSLLIGTYTLGIRQGMELKDVMLKYTDAVKDVSIILLIVSGAGALKQVLEDSSVDVQIAALVKQWPIDPLVLGWILAAFIRVCVGSATVAGLTAAGILAPIVLAGGVNPQLMVISIGAGSLFFSHVNDAGFWMYKEYFNLSMKETFMSWSLMETIVSILGLIGVIVLNQFV